jgi:hypothetical protein
LREKNGGGQIAAAIIRAKCHYHHQGGGQGAATAGVEGVTRMAPTEPLKAAIVNNARKNFFIMISCKNAYY